MSESVEDEKGARLLCELCKSHSVWRICLCHRGVIDQVLWAGGSICADDLKAAHVES